MPRLRQLSIIIIIALSSTLSVQPQQATDTATYFEKAGVLFDLPAGWNATEKNLLGEQIVTIQPGQGPTQIAVSATLISSCDFQAEARKTTAALVERVARQIHSPAPIKFSVTKTQVNAEEIEGVSLLGVADERAVTADVYSFRVGLRFISLVYVRVENDEAANSAWNTVRTNLKVQPGARPGVVTLSGVAGEAPEASRPLISGGVLNGKAIRLPTPSYPPIARQAHAGGVAVVQVTIDESGAVIAAHAVSGHPLLQSASVAAAREAQFSPTKLCNEPVKVTGVITYHFIAR